MGNNIKLSDEHKPELGRRPIKKRVWVILSIPIVLFLIFAWVSILSPYMEFKKQFAMARNRLVLLAAEERVEFLTIDPRLYNPAADIDTDRIDKYEVIDAREVDDPELQVEMLTGLIETEEDGEMMACFNPHHAIRSKDNPDLFVIVCFECNALRISEYSISLSLSAHGRSLYTVYEEFIKQYKMKTVWDRYEEENIE